MCRVSEFVQAAKGSGLNSVHVGNVLDWSFQQALDEVTESELGTKWVGPSAVPVLDAASRMAVAHRDVCEDVMRWVIADKSSTEETRSEARTQFLSTSRRVTVMAASKRDQAEGRLFRDVEGKQRDVKLFWATFKSVRSSIVDSKSPPPVAVDADGNTVTEPKAVLAAWRAFCASIANADLEGTQEEGIYDEEYKGEVEERLDWLRKVRIHQPDLDCPITREEIWRAIRKLKMGKAPGEDGILTDILKSAADAVGTSKLKGTNPVVDALVLIFNYVFEHEIWPERWGTGVIFPLHKHDSRLDPSNYRPITLLSVVGKLFGTIVNARLASFSESTGTISDEQGGFRRARGTPDQIFIFREILASRKERGLATYATYVDARKAYDTVWRVQAYSRIHDSGVRGRLWRQLQSMHAGLTRRVQHPLGLTGSFPVDRGVAQGAVESPWVYSNFIDSLAVQLKRAGFGVMVAGVRVPLLMYADDIVLLAGSPDELEAMNGIVSEFARQNRFQFNGEKSAVMVFNVTVVARAACSSRRWSLSGETVEVRESYTYLGAITTQTAGGLGWKDHVGDAIAKARRRSADLLWVCRADRGIRPRTAVTLWQSIVRPLLEYASELWSGQITDTLTKEAEKVQMRFLRGTLGLHGNGSGVADDVVRAEAGVEPLRDRWAKLRLGYWRRLFAAQPQRLLYRVAAFRRRERVLSGGRGLGSMGWMASAERTLRSHGMVSVWYIPSQATAHTQVEWRERVYEAVEAQSDVDRVARGVGMSTVMQYAQLKEWGANTASYSFSSGEVGRLGRLVPERYLDDRSDLKGTRVKMLCRLGCLPLMNRVGREQRPPWPKAARVCPCCDLGVVEDVHHFIMVCPMHADRRARLLSHAHAVVERAIPVRRQGGVLETVDFAGSSVQAQCRVLLGGRIGDPFSEDRLDKMVKRYLRKSWNCRHRVTEAINSVLGTSYGVFVPKPK